NYTGTVHFASSDPKAVLPADYTFTTVDAGVHTFTATLETAGVQSITARDMTNSSITGTLGNIFVNPESRAALTVGGFPSSDAAGTAQTVTVKATDAYGNLISGYRGKVHFTSTDPQAALPADYTFTSTDAGSHSFIVTLKTAGTQSISVADTANA